MKLYNARVASGRFTKKAQVATRFSTNAELGPAPAPGVTTPDDSSPPTAMSPAVSGKSVRDAGITVVTQRKCQNESADEGAHRYPRKNWNTLSKLYVATNVCSEPDAEKHIYKIWPAKAKAQSEQVSCID
jgi:hypothetical protein